jgi:UDP-3-O-[3-hydroxymyristoyl] N-acetylglucosamine deacetylase/3-hydroxyacyl-[acyl-carrier-protein] dehydratase
MSVHAPRLPHRSPFVLLDRVVEISGTRGVFTKVVSAGDPCVTPSGTLPAVFLIEVLAQAGGAYLNADEGGQAGMLAKVDGFTLHEPVRVGDELRIEVELQRRVRAATLFRGRLLVGDAVRAEGAFTLALPS